MATEKLNPEKKEHEKAREKAIRHAKNLAVPPDPNILTMPEAVPDELDPAYYLGDQYVMTEAERTHKPWEQEEDLEELKE